MLKFGDNDPVPTTKQSAGVFVKDVTFDEPATYPIDVILTINGKTETFPDVEKSMPDLMRIAIERGSYDMMARLRALSHIRWKWPVLADAVQIKDDKERKRFLDKNYDPLKPGRYTCNSFYRR